MQCQGAVVNGALLLYTERYSSGSIAMDEKIFKAYDIRGIVPDQLDSEFAFLLGRAYATMRHKELSGKRMTIAVGGDMRLSTPDLKTRLIEGLIVSGVDVVDVGLISTPTFYFSVAFFGYDGGIQVSASHNPKEHNGFKMIRDRGVPISRDTGMNVLKELVQSRQFVQARGKGKITKGPDILADAVREESTGIDRKSIRPLTVVVDAANAMGALDVNAMFKELPCKLIRINFDLDGTFPSHQPNPLDENNLEILRGAVREHHADLGIAPDGDGDRYFFIDEKGDVVRQEILRGIMAQLALKKHPGATVCYDIRPGRITRDMIEEAGGRAVVTPVGHSLIKEVMIRENAVFGGESSGHYFYKFTFGTFEAPIKLVLTFLDYVSKKGKPVSEIIQPYRKYFHSGEINSRVHDVKATLDRVKKRFSDGAPNLLDGVTVEYPDWWFNVRGSNTEPLIRLNLEATSKDLMEQKQDEVLGVIRE